MNHSIYSADRSTHLKIVVIALFILGMIGRGGLWTKEEITLMADYLGTDFGPNAKPATQTR